jgi:hypothetical protein
MSNVVRFPPGAPKSSVSPEEAEKDLRWAIFRLLQAHGPAGALIRLEAAAARLRENLT